MRARLLIILVILPVIATLDSCKKGKTEMPVSPLVTITLADNFIIPDYKAILFVSDASGKVLADTTCLENGTYTLFPVGPSSISSRISVTIVNYEPSWHGFKVHLNTYTGIMPGSVWLIRGAKPDTAGHIAINLLNVPSPPGEILYSSSGFSNLTFGTVGKVAVLYQSPDELYIKLHRPGVDKIKMVGGITAGSTYDIDMTDAVNAAFRDISFPFPALVYEADIWGYHGADHDSRIPVKVEMLLSNGLTDTIRVHYPSSGFSGFHTEIRIQENYASEVAYLYQTDGEVPAAFVKADAIIGPVTTTKRSATIEAAGTFDMVRMQWMYTYAFQYFEWTIYGPDTLRTAVLPEIPHSLSVLFPALVTDSLVYSGSILTDFLVTATYDDFIAKTFDPSASVPYRPFDASSVEKNVVLKK